jgi:L-lactate dehydrogenase complex protein LldF
MPSKRTTFRQRIQQSIANPTLQIALDNNATNRIKGRNAAFATLAGDPNLLRKKARLIRQDVIAHLDTYLAQFVEKISQNGFQVHFAATAEEAQNIIVQIAQSHQASVVAKSKSMVSEEIDLNSALEKQGIKAVETDLGEFIIQLRGEHPAHIITPAVHLRRQDVAKTFNEFFNMPLTDDVKQMNDVAHRELRQIFLTADIGLSGVNFGVAETGTMCIVTNEGNGRMVTTVPPVHIALMGIERLVPNLKDLALMLQLLPRSATGQKITSYVSLIQSPRKNGDQDGPQERHLILLDNNRRDLAHSPLQESLLCIRCGACLNACPVFREIGGHAYGSPYPGPIGSIVSPGLFGITEYGHLAKASSLCGACMDICPVEINFPQLLLRTRSEYVAQVSQPIKYRAGMWLYQYVTTRPGLYRRAARVAALLTSVFARKESWLPTLPPPLNDWTISRHFPPFSATSFHDRWKTRQKYESSMVINDELQADEMLNKTQEKISQTETARTLSNAEAAAQFKLELEKLGGEFIRCSLDDVYAKINSKLQEWGAETLLVWEDLSIPEDLDLHKRLGQDGYTLLATKLMLRNPGRKEGIQWLSQADTGITGAYAALADTGTVVVASGENHSQLCSLLPANHLVILPIDRIFPNLEDWIEQIGKAVIQQKQCVSLISGPSRTADIEMTLTIGVHGPGKVAVFGLDRSTVAVSI